MYNTIVTLKKGEGRTLKAGGCGSLTMRSHPLWEILRMVIL